MSVLNFDGLAWVVAVLVVAKTATQWTLERLNRSHVQAHRGRIPEALAGTMDNVTFSRSIDYTLAKSRLHTVEIVFSSLMLLLVLFSGILPAAWAGSGLRQGSSAWGVGLFIFAVGLGLSLAGLPLDWYAQFRLEQRFGFNTTTQRTWWLDRLKGLALSLLLGYPLLALILKLVDWTGPAWWLWSWAALLGFQLIMVVLAPIVILPLFNKFSPLPEGTLKSRLIALALRTGFHARSIQVMDGSKRSRHSNAFFTGFGRFRKIVLFDTLIQHLAEDELEAVLAHEIGHYKKKHIPKMLLASTAGSFVAFYLLSLLSRQDWFYAAFGFEPGHVGIALLLFALLSGVVTFWLSPAAHWWSRRYEYQADAFAAETMREPQPLIGALRKLNRENLSNLVPHRVYSAFYYSHPTLLEREKALSG